MSVTPKKILKQWLCKILEATPKILHEKGELWAILKWYGEKYLKPFYYSINMY